MNLLWVVDLVVGCCVLMLGIIQILVGSVLFCVLVYHREQKALDS